MTAVSRLPSSKEHDPTTGQRNKATFSDNLNIAPYTDGSIVSAVVSQAGRTHLVHSLSTTYQENLPIPWTRIYEEAVGSCVPRPFNMAVDGIPPGRTLSTGMILSQESQALELRLRNC